MSCSHWWGSSCLICRSSWAIAPCGLGHVTQRGVERFLCLGIHSWPIVAGGQAVLVEHVVADPRSAGRSRCVGGGLGLGGDGRRSARWPGHVWGRRSATRGAAVRRMASARRLCRSASLVADRLLAGLTVGVVALPLALAFGISTGLGAQAGLITAIVAGVVAAVFGGSNVQVSGPTGAMTVVLVPVVARYGADAVYVVGVMAGVLIVVAAFARVGRLLAYIPWPVIEGFTVGIAAIIFLQQVPAAWACRSQRVRTPRRSRSARCGAALGGDGSLAASRIAVARCGRDGLLSPKLRRALPASLLAVIVATRVAELAHLTVAADWHIADRCRRRHCRTCRAGRIERVVRTSLRRRGVGGN